MLRYKILYSLILIKSLTFARIFNLVKLKISFWISILFKKHFLWGMPSFISIEPTNICNLRCPECPTGNDSSSVEKGNITIETFKQIINEIKKHALFINFYFQGEPFINKQANEMIRIARDANITVATSTNAHYITEENAKEIVKSGLSKIIVSLDGYNQETYEVYRKNGSFNKVIEGLKALNKAKKELNSKTPLVELQCLLLSHTEKETAKIRTIGKEHNVDAVVFKTAQFYSIENLHLVPKNKKNSRYVLDETKGKLILKTPPKNKCWRMWNSIVFAWNGNVLPCCFDKDHTFSYGNILAQPLNAILKNKMTYSFKKTVHTNRQKISMCQNCTS